MSAETQFWDLYGKLQASNREIMALEDAMRRSPAVARAVGNDVIALRKQQTDLATQFTMVYTGVTGGTPTGIAGLGGLGAAPPLVIAGWGITILAGIAVAFGGFWLAIQNTKVKAQSVQAQANMLAETNRAVILQRADEADARGDHAEAERLRAQAATPGVVPPANQDFFAWFQDNWIWVAGAAAAVFVLPELVRKI